MSKTNDTVEMDRRNSDDRREGDRRQQDLSVDVERRGEGNERRKVQRRRQIDPTTCERDYSDHEIEFMTALDQYKRDSGRMFPTCSEILEVIRGLGYVRLADIEDQLIDSPADAEAESDGGDEGMIV